jgi:flavin reductase (DIM6/NTAB) family NADH-FMN oxidoreductase RutF
MASPSPASPSAARTVFDPADPEVNAYKLLNSLVVPRPIAWVSTVDAEGRGNLAPHSFFTVASGRPPVILFSSLGHKDTVTNIEQTGEFVVSITSEDLFEQVNASSAPFEHGDDEARLLGIDTEPSTTVRPERVAASPASIECRLERILRRLRPGHRDHGAHRGARGRHPPDDRAPAAGLAAGA